MTAKKINQKYTPEELADAFVFRNRLTEKQEQDAADQLAEARKKIKESRTESQVLYGAILQLRFLIEDYIQSEKFDEQFTFAHFLRKYIRLNYKINKQFAKDIQLDETELSSILNHHRMPSEKTMIRLELHSNNMIPATSWYKLVEKEKEHALQTDQSLRKEQSKYVTNRLVFDF